MRGLLIANGDDADPGVVGDHLGSRAVELVRCVREDPATWPALDGHHLVVLLGSDWSVYWEHVADEVEAERALVRDAHERGIPILGICFGAQVVASALGGVVERAPRPEIGWCTVDSDRPELIDPGPWLQWHYDRFTVPPGAVELARSEVGPQAFELGRTLAVQFHPEVTPAIVERWSRGAGADELLHQGVDPSRLRRDTEQGAVRSGAAAEPLVARVCRHLV